MFAFGLLVWALASLPSILILDNAYVLGSPRLFYLASVGVALVCALPVLALERLFEIESWHLKFGLVALLFAICYLPSAGYTRCELAYQGMAGEVGRMMADAARSTLARGDLCQPAILFLVARPRHRVPQSICVCADRRRRHSALCRRARFCRLQRRAGPPCPRPSPCANINPAGRLLAHPSPVEQLRERLNDIARVCVRPDALALA